MKKILVIDIETTGFSKEKDVIVEVGIVSLDLDTGKIEALYDRVIYDDRFNLNYHVERDRHGWIFDNTDLTPQCVFAGEHLAAEIPVIQEILNSYPLGATAYNNAFDFGFFEANGITIPKKLDCPMKLSTDICKIAGKRGYKWPSVQEAYDFFFLDNDYVEKHRGADDAAHEAEIVRELYTRDVFKI